jgi:hypothetical protein
MQAGVYAPARMDSNPSKLFLVLLLLLLLLLWLKSWFDDDLSFTILYILY